MSAVLDSIEAQSQKLFPDGGAILVAVSGGLDSMVLLHALNHFAGQHQWRLIVAHFNHRLRGNASRADQRFVEKSARQLRLPCITGLWEKDQKLIKEHGLEMAARQARHEFLAQVAKKRRCGTVAIAHHLDDQAETFLWRLMRGAGGKGLGGMRARDPFPGHPKLTVARPFLQTPKRDLRQFAECESIQFREDASNDDSHHLRNRIRHQLLPELRRNFNPEIDRAILQSQGLVQADADFASAAAQEWLESPKRTSFNQLHTALQRWVIWHQLIEQGVEPLYQHIERLRHSTDQPFSINAHQTLYRDWEGVVHLQQTPTLTFSPDQLSLTPTGRWTEVEFSNTIIRCRITSSKPARMRGELLDADRIGEKILLRHWRPGDRFQPIGMRQSVKLQDLFTNAKIPAYEKRRRVLASTEQGQLFWIQNLRIGDLAKITHKTKRFLQWNWQPA